MFGVKRKKCAHVYHYIGETYESMSTGVDVIVDRVHTIYCPKCDSQRNFSDYSNAMAQVEMSKLRNGVAEDAGK